MADEERFLEDEAAQPGEEVEVGKKVGFFNSKSDFSGNYFKMGSYRNSGVALSFCSGIYGSPDCLSG